MVDIEKLDKQLQLLALKKNELDRMGYDNPDYDDMEEALHDLEDEFLDQYGEFLEDALHNVHDEFCPDNDVLLPIAYMANQYTISEDHQFSAKFNAGVFVDADDYPGKMTKLVLIPNPTRLVLNIDRDNSKVVWSTEKVDG